MGFTEKNAIEAIKSLLDFSDISKIRQILKSINPNIFENKDIRIKFKEILVNIYNVNDINYLKKMSQEFIKNYDKYKGTYHFWFCSGQFREKFKRKDFRDPVERKRFRGIIDGIIKAKKDYPTEDIGEFFISPRGNEDYRVAWFIKDNSIYFCEQFHHDKEYDKFCDNARFKKVVRKNYSSWNYIEDFTPLNLRAA